MADLPKCLVAPVRDGYNMAPGNQVVSVQLNGGAPRNRADQLGAVGLCSIQWSVGRKDYDYLMAFYRSMISQGALPFVMDLIFEGSDLKEYQVTLVPGTFKLTSQAGHTYIVQASLYVVPSPDDPNGDNMLLARNS